MKKENKEIDVYVSPYMREIVETFISATCDYFEITREELIEGVATEIVGYRYLCFWLIRKSSNGDLSYKVIGSFFNKKKTAVSEGVYMIEIHKNIYRKTIGNLRQIVIRANNLQRKFDWKIEEV